MCLLVVNPRKLEGTDVLNVSVDQLADHVASDGTNESQSGHLDKLLSLAEGEGALAVSGHGSGENLGPS